MPKQPSHSDERPIADSAPDSGEKPFDPSHFGRHQFPDGLREELIKAEKPRIDPKFLQDTVPPNRKPVLTEPEPVVTTPRGGFVAPKAQAASPIDRDATTLIKVPTVKLAPPVVASKAADSPSAPPVDTSRTDVTVVLPVARKKDSRSLVVGVVAGLLVLLVVGFWIRSPGEGAQTSGTPTPKATAAAPDVAPASQPVPTGSIDTAQTAQSPLATPTPPSAASSSSAKKKTAPSSKPLPTVKPVPAGAKTRPGFDPSKPWEED